MANDDDCDYRYRPTQAAVDAEARIPRLHSVADLIALVPGSSRANWIRRWIPELIAANVIVKRGRKFLGRPVDVVNALLDSAPACPSDARK